MSNRSSQPITVDRRTFLRLCGLAGVTVTAGSLIGCSSSPSTTSNSAVQDIHDISSSRPATSTHIKAIIKAKGFDKTHGLNLIEEVRPTLDAYYNDVAANNVPMNDSGRRPYLGQYAQQGRPGEDYAIYGTDRPLHCREIQSL